VATPPSTCFAAEHVENACLRVYWAQALQAESFTISLNHKQRVLGAGFVNPAGGLYRSPPPLH